MCQCYFWKIIIIFRPWSIPNPFKLAKHFHLNIFLHFLWHFSIIWILFSVWRYIRRNVLFEVALLLVMELFLKVEHCMNVIRVISRTPSLQMHMDRAKTAAPLCFPLWKLHRKNKNNFNDVSLLGQPVCRQECLFWYSYWAAILSFTSLFSNLFMFPIFCYRLQWLEKIWIFICF